MNPNSTETPVHIHVFPQIIRKRNRFILYLYSALILHEEIHEQNLHSNIDNIQ